MRERRLKMSQAKVDRHKYEKYNRKKIVAKQKVNRFLGYLILVAIIALIVVWAVFSARAKLGSGEETTVEQTYVNTTAIDDYFANME